jgi:NADH:ubiquinone oxidoreductase subunit 6 (subunit J)
MAYFALFVMLSLLELASLALLFVFKDALHAVLSLTAAFSVSALLFLALEQPLLALLQLFVMVGGIATYLFVGAASAGIPRSMHTNYAILALLSIALFAAIYYGASSTKFLSAQGSPLSEQAIASSLSSNIALLYVIALMLFGIGIGTIALLRKIG